MHGVGEIRRDDVADPKLRDDIDAIVRITASAICGADLHPVRGGSDVSRPRFTPEIPNVAPSRRVRHRAPASPPRRGEGVLAGLAKAAAYSQAPRLTFTVLHPKQAVQLKKLSFDLRTAYAPRVAAVIAAAIALPLGVALGRAIERRATRGNAPGTPGRGGGVQDPRLPPDA